VLARYVPTLGAFLRQSRTPCLHLRYEVLVTDPESCLRQACAHAGLAFEPAIIDYGGAERRPVANSYGVWVIPLPSIGAARHHKVSISGPRSLPLPRINADFCTTSSHGWIRQTWRRSVIPLKHSGNRSMPWVRLLGSDRHR